MEVREKDKEMEMPSSLGYYTSADYPDRRRRSATTDHQTDASHQTLDHHHHHRGPPAYLYHHQNAEKEKPSKRDSDPAQDQDLDPDPDPVSAAPVAPLPRSYARPLPLVPAHQQPRARYRECQRNHAASSGGHVVDGCGEFMPAGEEGTPEALKCAACECHRSFHRKEVDGERVMSLHAYSHYDTVTPRRSNPQRNQVFPPPRQPPPVLLHHHHVSPIMMSFGGGGGGGPAESSTEDLNVFHQSFNANGADQLQQPKKRFRTKFNQEQKDKMFEFAEKIGWRITKQDEEEVQRFCSQVNVKRQVFKVWMHNNKQAAKKKQM